jgi:pantetheine-phosphate adenylyltransferase
MIAITLKFRNVATGGTFDEIHIGHIALLSKAFQSGEHVIIGVSSDEFARKRGKKIRHSYQERVANLRKAIAAEFGTVSYEIAELDADFGPAVVSTEVGALIASSETQSKATILNEMRTRRGLDPVQVISVKLVKAKDGFPVSSTRIRAGEIDRRGNKVTTERTEKDKTNQ